nr:hypothetical protein [Pandoravirus massiliensis]
MKRGRNVYHSMSALLHRTAPQHGGEVATAVCVVSGVTRDAAKATTIVLVPYQVRGASASKTNLDGWASKVKLPGWHVPLCRSRHDDPLSPHMERSGATSHTWWPRDIVAHVGACGKCVEAAREALTTLDAGDFSLDARETAARVSDAIYDTKRCSTWAIGALCH